MIRWTIRLLLLLITLTFLVLLRAPAKHAIAYASDAIKPTVISGPSGTVWSGQASSLVHPQIRLNNLRWDYRALASLVSGPGFAVNGKTENGQFDADAHIGWGQLTTPGSASLSNVNAIVPLSDLPLPPIAKSIPLSGDIQLQLDRAILDAQWPTKADGKAVLAGLQFKDKTLWDLGAVIADLESVENGIKATLSSDSNHIQLQGIANLGHDGSYSVTADLTLGNNLPIVLRTMLSAAGKRQTDGSIRISYQGQVPRPQADAAS